MNNDVNSRLLFSAKWAIL